MLRRYLLKLQRHGFIESSLIIILSAIRVFGKAFVMIMISPYVSIFLGYINWFPKIQKVQVSNPQNI